MKVRFIKPWQLYNTGDVIEPGGVFRDWLLQCKFVELVKEETKIETATSETRECAVVPVKRKRGRPRKNPAMVSRPSSEVMRDAGLSS